MNITIEIMPVEQKSVLVQLMELYSYDFSLYSNDDVNEHGYYGYSHIDDYWNEDGRYPYLIRADGKIAGFVLVRSCYEYIVTPHCDIEMPEPHNIAEFFIMQKYRRQGIGRQAAMCIFDMHRGGWEVSQWANNVQAQRFWGEVINEYTGGKFNTFSTADKMYVGFTFVNSEILNNHNT